MSGNANNKFIRYFRNPLLGISSFSAYGLPNSMVHMPVVFMTVYAGICICGRGMKVLLPIYFIIALYTARDIVVLSYRNVLIPAAVWGVFVPFIIFRKEVAAFLTFDSSQDSMTFTAAVAFAFVVHVIIHTKYFIEQR